MIRENTKDAILDAAEAIVREQGAAHLTLDAAAERAGMSKGGVLYHFQTKDSLLVALVQRMTQAFQGLYEEARERMGNDPKRMLEAYLEAVTGGRGAARQHLVFAHSGAGVESGTARADPHVLQAPLRAARRRHRWAGSRRRW